jgi:transcriptional regulator with XRE-family HTH domain
MLTCMDTPTASRTDLNKAVTAEIRALLARRRMRQSAFATQLGETEVWVSRRLRGVQALSLDDLDAMCRVLRVEPANLVASALREAYTNNQGNSAVPDRPTDNRPPARPNGRGDRPLSTSPGTRRTRMIGSFHSMATSGAAE